MARHNPKNNTYGVDGSGKPVEPQPDIEYFALPKRVQQELKKIYKRKKKKKTTSQ